MTDIFSLLESGKEDVFFRVSCSESQYSDPRHLHIEISFVTRDSDGEMHFYNNYYGDKHHYKGLAISGNVTKGEDLGKVFYEGICFSSSHLDTHLNTEKISKMLKTLNGIQKKLGNISSSEGLLRDFIDYLLRVARVMKVKGFYFSAGNVKDRFFNSVGSLESEISFQLDAFNKVTENYL